MSYVSTEIHKNETMLLHRFHYFRLSLSPSLLNGFDLYDQPAPCWVSIKWRGVDISICRTHRAAIDQHAQSMSLVALDANVIIRRWTVGSVHDSKTPFYCRV